MRPVNKNGATGDDCTDGRWERLPAPGESHQRGGKKSLCRLEERTPQDWLEWQANVFAASLIMPRATFQTALVETQKAFGITRNLGVGWLSDNEPSHRDFQLLGNRLANIYGVSLTSIRVRLNTLKLLHDASARSVRSAHQILAFPAGLPPHA